MRAFAQYYDLIYSDKDYAKDVAILKQLLPDMARPNILEIGSGTGNQSLLLAAFANVTAVEMDADFAAIMRKKINMALTSITLFEGDLSGLSHYHFDAAAAFFHVVNYVQDDGALLHLFQEISKRLKPGARLLFDMWQGERALADPPRTETRVKKFSAGRADGHTGGQVVQTIHPVMDHAARRVELTYDIAVTFDGAQQNPAPFEEKITLHLWQRDEILRALSQAGFSEVVFHDGRNFPARATPESWTLWVTARNAVGQSETKGLS